MVLVLREEDERLLQLGLVVSLGHLGYHYVQEITVVDQNHSLFVLVVTATLGVVVQVLDQSLDLLLGRLKAESSKGYFKVLDVYAAGATCVEEGKGFLDLCLLLLGQFVPVLVASLLFLRLCAYSLIFGWEFFDSVWLVFIAFLGLKKSYWSKSRRNVVNLNFVGRELLPF